MATRTELDTIYQRHMEELDPIYQRQAEELDPIYQRHQAERTAARRKAGETP